MARIRTRFKEITFQTSLIEFPSIQNKEITLDLTSVTWIEPFGILFLKVLFSMLLENGNKLEVHFNDEIKNYIIRMNLPNFFLGNRSIDFVPEIRNVSLRRNDLANRLMELQSFTVTNDDEVNEVVLRISSIVSRKIPFYQRITDRLELSFSELISNIQVHSQTNTAMVVLQSYANSVKLAVGDEGIGIKRGLKQHGHGLEDDEAIEKALEPQISGRADGGGMGLTELVYYIKKNNDEIGFRSGEGYLIIQNNEVRKGLSSYLPGTLVNVELRCF